MNTRKLISIALLAGLPGLALAEGVGDARYAGDDLARQSGNLRYVGNNLAKQVCTAVVNDDVRKLKLALLSYKHSLAHSYTFDPAGRELAGDFSCNGMDVQAFSIHMGASRVAGFISGTGDAPDAQVAASGS